jgi:hypothetical protein
VHSHHTDHEQDNLKHESGRIAIIIWGPVVHDEPWPLFYSFLII